MDIGGLYWSFLIGTIGIGYAWYGKKVANILMLISGIGMMFYPYFVSNIWISIIVGILFVILPFVLRR